MASQRQRPSPQARMHELIQLACIPRLIQIAARFGIADQLLRGPQTPAALAKRLDLHPGCLARMLRALASVGVFAEVAGGRFRLTPMARTLCSKTPDSLFDWARVANNPMVWNAFGDLEHAIATGGLPFEHVHGASLFAHLQQHPDKERDFAQAMASFSIVENEAVARAYPFGKFARVVDVGGAHGHLLATILRRFRKLHGVLYDQPQVVATAAHSGYISAAGVRERCETVGGSFFDSVPAGAGAYVLKHVIHDWDDEQSVRLLRNCRAAMVPGARVLVVEHVLATGNGADLGKLMDIAMMTLTGGMERTAAEFRALLSQAQLRMTRVIPTRSGLGIVEAVAA